jgi:HSP20 family molecular chaperone IbpA
LKSKRAAEEIPLYMETLADMLPSGTDLNAPGWREARKKKRRCPSCGNEREEKELMEEGCLICGWTPQPKIEKLAATKEVIVEKPPERITLVDLFDEPDHVKIVMEAPETEEDGISVRVDPNGHTLIVAMSNKMEKIELPCAVTGDPIVSLKHGALEVKVKKHAH